MKAVQIPRIGSPPELVELDEPGRGPDQVLLDMEAVALNPIDISTATGRFYGGSPPTPYVAGSEGVGRVVEGERLAPGTRVHVARSGHGTLAERAALSEQWAVPVREGVDAVMAAAFGTAGLAGWLPVAWRTPVRAGERVLVLGATGASGLVALQAARLLGAARVVAAGRRPEGLARAAALGADATVSLHEEPLADALRRASGGDGPTLVVDPLWGPPLVAALEAAAPGARIVHFGQSAGAEASIPSSLVRGKQLELSGFSNFAVPADVWHDAYAELLEHARAGRIRLEIETYPLERIGEAWERQAAVPGAKLVVTVR
jgi:NADPH:quinone reductase